MVYVTSASFKEDVLKIKDRDFSTSGKRSSREVRIGLAILCIVGTSNVDELVERNEKISFKLIGREKILRFLKLLENQVPYRYSDFIKYLREKVLPPTYENEANLQDVLTSTHHKIEEKPISIESTGLSFSSNLPLLKMSPAMQDLPSNQNDEIEASDHEKTKQSDTLFLLQQWVNDRNPEEKPISIESTRLPFDGNLPLLEMSSGIQDLSNNQNNETEVSDHEKTKQSDTLFLLQQWINDKKHKPLNLTQQKLTDRVEPIANSTEDRGSTKGTDHKVKKRKRKKRKK